MLSDNAKCIYKIWESGIPNDSEEKRIEVLIYKIVGLTLELQESKSDICVGIDKLRNS